LVPPACWLRDGDVEKYEEEPGPRASVTGVPASSVSGDQVLAAISAHIEALSRPDASGQMLMKAKDMDAVLDELQKAALYFGAIGDDERERVFGALAATMTAQLEAIAPGIMGDNRDYARKTIALRREMDPIDYPGGDPRIKRKLETLLFLRGMKEREILVVMLQDSALRDQIAPLYPHLLKRVHEMEERPSWWSRVLGRRKS
jgi:hypothetical protein